MIRNTDDLGRLHKSIQKWFPRTATLGTSQVTAILSNVKTRRSRSFRESITHYRRQGKECDTQMSVLVAVQFFFIQVISSLSVTLKTFQSSLRRFPHVLISAVFKLLNKT